MADSVAIASGKKYKLEIDSIQLVCAVAGDEIGFHFFSKCCLITKIFYI